MENAEYKAVSFGTLPESIESTSSPAAIDLLKKLLQPEPRLRIKSVLALQRIAFYMGHDIRSYTLKKVSTILRNISCRVPTKSTIYTDLCVVLEQFFNTFWQS